MWGTAAAIAILAVVLGGCVSIKSQTTSQRAPGVISLNIVVCASDGNRDVQPPIDCDPDGADRNTAEGDNSGDATDDSLGQVLAAFRVPAGSVAPDSFPSATQDVFFNASATYTAELNREHPPPAGQRWFGYISTPKFFDLDSVSGRQTSFQPEFTLPQQADGAPFAGPFGWRVVVGLRRVLDQNQAGAPVNCSSADTACFDSPVTANIATNLSAAVSDFGVVTGTSATAGHGETATLSFPVQYLDGRGIGPSDLSIAATTTLPGTTATPSATTLRVSPGSRTTVDVTVPVPAGTPLGDYTVTLSAAGGSPAVTRSNTATLQVSDKLAPSIRISTPAEGATFVQGQSVAADYACTEELNGTGIARCAGPVAPGAAIDTGSPGTKSFRVDASDNAGNAASSTRTYTVVAPPPKRILAGVSFDVRRFPSFTVFTRLQVKRVPAGSVVKATCSFRKKKCPGKARKAFTKRRARGVVSLNKRYKGVRLRPGTKITVRVTKPGHIGAVKHVTVRRSDNPSIKDLCLPPGAKRARSRC